MLQQQQTLGGLQRQPNHIKEKMITTEYGKNNIYPNEPPIQLLPQRKLMSPEAERFNGWAAMLGFVAAVGAYATTGQIIPGVF